MRNVSKTIQSSPKPWERRIPFAKTMGDQGVAALTDKFPKGFVCNTFKGVLHWNTSKGVFKSLGGKSQVELIVSKSSTPLSRLTPSEAIGGSPYKNNPQLEYLRFNEVKKK